MSDSDILPPCPDWRPRRAMLRQVKRRLLRAWWRLSARWEGFWHTW